MFKRTNNYKILISVLAFGVFPSLAFAYFDNYPPYQFKDGAPKHLKVRPLVGFDKSKYKSKDGKIIIKLKETADSFNFLLKDGKFILVDINKELVPLPSSVYQLDLDKNGLNDFIVFYNYRGNGLASQKDKVDIFLKKKNSSYVKISFDTFSSGLEDFVDLNNNGSYEVIITDLFRGDKHNYFSYSIYKLKDYRLVNADNQFKDFPKFVWITYKANDKDTTHLISKDRLLHTQKKNNSIRYREISGE